MAKINKVYPPFFNGVSQQNPELILDNQCKEMVNCVPDLVIGLQKRPPAKYKDSRDFATYPIMADSKVFHTYDRGEDNEEYIFVSTNSATDPLLVFNKEGVAMNVVYASPNAAACKAYLAQKNLKGLTVQDRTWLLSKNAVVDLDYTATTPLSANYTRQAFYWLKRGSGDRYNPFNYAVYLDGTTFSVDPDKPSNATSDPTTGAEDSDVAAELLRVKVNADSRFTCTRLGSLLKIVRTDGGDFTFSSWDSWGNQASEGWKGSVNSISDLPKEMPFSDVYVKITGTADNTFTDYFVRWGGSSWIECLDPEADRGKLTNMPISCDRTALVAGVATFTIDLIDWSLPIVGSLENNPNPSFAPSETGIKRKISDLFFYKNRLGLSAEDSVVLSEAANYTNFYATTVVDNVDTDVIDVTVASGQASRIHYVKPFNNSLYIFTKLAQYELLSEGGFSASTVALVNTSNYPINENVEPVVMNDSLYFISTTNNQQQLREYIKTDNLNVKGIDLNISTPTYLKAPITRLIVDGVLGFVLCCTDDHEIYLYNYKEDGAKRIQSSWSTWSLLENLPHTADSFEYFNLAATVLIMCKTSTDYIYHQLQLDYNVADDNVDTSWVDGEVTEFPYESKVQLPDYYPQLGTIRTPMNKMLIKKVTIQGEGTFDVDVYRKDYNRTYTKSHLLGLADLDLHVASKVGNVDITIKDSSEKDFLISSVVIEGLFSTTSREMK